MRILVAVMVFSACASARAQQWSATTVQAVPGHEPFYAMTSVDTPTARLTVWAEHYGVPWAAFAASSHPPPSWPWTHTMRALAEAARATGKPIDLQMVLTRDVPAPHATETGLVPMPPCLDLAGYRTAYARYVAWMVRQFAPATVNVGAEISRFPVVCGTSSSWMSVITAANAGYRAAKRVRPDALVYVSAQLEDMYDHTLGGWNDAVYAALSGLQRDRFGLSTYPQALAGDRVERLPLDYLTRVRARHPAERPLVIAETGWLAMPLVLGTPEACWTALTGSPETQAAYRAWLTTHAAIDGLEWVTWWSAQDLLPADVMTTCYPRDCPPDDPWCAALQAFRAAFGAPLGDLVFKAFGTMGLATYTGGGRE
jgi:hypothetical protein